MEIFIYFIKDLFSGDSAIQITAIATMLTAYFSFLAIKQARESVVRPIIDFGELSYYTNEISFNLISLSENVDRWGKDIKIIIGSSFKKKITIFNPGRDAYFKFEYKNEDEWLNKNIVLSYKSIYNKKYKLYYKLLKSENPPPKVKLERIYKITYYQDRFIDFLKNIKEIIKNAFINKK